MTKKGNPGYNRTHLPMDLAEERQIIHRDFLAHCLRWSHVIKNCEVGERVLDLGCADGPLGMALYTNRYKPELYLGCDIREGMVEKGREKLAMTQWARFMTLDLCKEMYRLVSLTPVKGWSIITSFEFIEHIPEKEVEPFLLNVKSLMTKDTVFYLSTPCFNGTDKAANHIKEWGYQELKDLLGKHFYIDAKFGTFMSQKDFKLAAQYPPLAQSILGLSKESIWNQLHSYYDSNLLSILFAPLFPEHSRNCIWRLKIL